jgi:hypothetical protein
MARPGTGGPKDGQIRAGDGPRRRSTDHNFLQRDITPWNAAKLALSRTLQVSLIVYCETRPVVAANLKKTTYFEKGYFHVRSS